VPELILGIDTSAGATVGLVRRTPVEELNFDSSKLSVAKPSSPEVTILATREIADTRSHAEELTPMIAEVLNEAGVTVSQLTQIVVGMGPAPFTGLRVGVVTAETLAWAAQIPIKHVSSLDVLALRAVLEPVAQLPQPFVAALDARRKQFYWAQYDSLATPITAAQVSNPEDIPGDGPHAGPVSSLDSRPVDAAFMAAHAGQLAEIGSEPQYLRPPDAELPKTRKSALHGASVRIGESRMDDRLER
jgi:tRNA threonylcarbamoyl adenosine modification protein YeaZ